MCREVNRNGLKKYLGKREGFEGTYQRLDLENNKILLINLTFKGKKKILAEHVWVDLPKERLYYPKDCKVSFIATVMSYRDSFGYLKYGVIHIHSLREVTELAKSASRKNAHDTKHAYNRKNRKRK